MGYLSQHQYLFLLEILTSLGGGPGGSALEGGEERKAAPEAESKPMELLKRVDTVEAEAARRLVASGDRTRLDVSLNMKGFRIELFSGDRLFKKSENEVSLSVFSLTTMNIKTCISVAGKLDVELVVNSFTIKDTRLDTTSVFRDIMPACEHSKQLLLRYTKEANGRPSLHLELDSPKLNLVLDHFYSVMGFFGAGPSQATPASSAPKKKIEAASAPEDPQAGADLAMAFCFKLVSPEIMVIEDASSEASEAIKVSAHLIKVEKERSMAFKVDGVSLSICPASKHNSPSALQVVDPFEVDMTFDSSVVRNVPMTKMAIVIAKPVMMRLSYNDIRLAMSITNKYVEVSKKANKTVDEKKLETKSEDHTFAEDIAQSLAEDATVSAPKTPSGSELVSSQFNLILHRFCLLVYCFVFLMAWIRLENSDEIQEQRSSAYSV
jgi:vacuolar protein sorting-associated protein 13A/C